jgi:hypothetical protein
MRGVFSVGGRDSLFVIRYYSLMRGVFSFEGTPYGNKIYSLMRGVSLWVRRDSLMARRSTH